MKKLKYLVYILVLIVIGIGGWLFTSANQGIMDVDFIVCKHSITVATGLIGAISLGCLLGLLASMLVIIRLKTSLKLADRKLQKK